MSEGDVSVKNTKTCSDEGADYETAISATGFGKFNLFLTLILIPSGLAISYESTTMSYVFPAAQCDLGLNLGDKGLLNAITYTGMISSAVVWGFLFDTLGRRRLLQIGFLLDGLCIIFSAFSQSKEMLVASKFLGGFIINGPYAALSSYISEFQCAKYRARMQLYIGMVFGGGGIIMPLMAWAILPRNIDFSVHNLEFHSWNIFLLIFSLPSVISAIIFTFMPETPKFLMTVGDNEKALALFQKIYALNSGKPTDSFPITQLVDEIELKKTSPDQSTSLITAKRSQFEALREGWKQMKPLFFRPHLPRIVLVCVIQGIFTMNVNTLRLWLPQIFQAMNEYEHIMNETATDVCKSLEIMRPSDDSSDCTVNLDNASIYLNSVLVGGTSLFCYIMASFFINILGKKKLLWVCGIISASFSTAIYFGTSSIQVIVFSALFVSSVAVPNMIILTIIIDAFPTSLRTMSLALSLMMGRVGATIGNFVFPFLISTGCAPPFFVFTALIIGCLLLTLLLPNTNLKALE